jgi:hypothetical protein
MNFISIEKFFIIVDELHLDYSSFDDIDLLRTVNNDTHFYDLYDFNNKFLFPFLKYKNEDLLIKIDILISLIISNGINLSSLPLSIKSYFDTFFNDFIYKYITKFFKHYYFNLDIITNLFFQHSIDLFIDSILNKGQGRNNYQIFHNDIDSFESLFIDIPIFIESDVELDTFNENIIKFLILNKSSFDFTPTIDKINRNKKNIFLHSFSFEFHSLVNSFKGSSASSFYKNIFLKFIRSNKITQNELNIIFDSNFNYSYNPFIFYSLLKSMPDHLFTFSNLSKFHYISDPSFIDKNLVLLTRKAFSKSGFNHHKFSISPSCNSIISKVSLIDSISSKKEASNFSLIFSYYVLFSSYGLRSSFSYSFFKRDKAIVEFYHFDKIINSFNSNFNTSSIVSKYLRFKTELFLSIKFSSSKKLPLFFISESKRDNSNSLLFL